MNNRRLSPMKGKRNKLVDLPDGAKARKGKRFKRNKITESVKEVRTLKEEKGTDIMIYDNETVTRRALNDTTDPNIPPDLHTFIHLIRDVQHNYCHFLREYYKKLDHKRCKPGLEYSTLQLAILAAKIDHGKARDVITPHIKNTESFYKPQEENTMENTNTNETVSPDVTQQVKDLFITRKQMLDRTRNIAMAASMGASMAVSATEMLITGDASKHKLAIAASSAVMSVGTTSVVMNVMDDGSFSNTKGALIGGGIGLTLGGVSAFGNRLFADSSVEE